MKVILSSAAARELVAESIKYESKASNLGSMFIDEFESATQRLTQFPESGHDFGPRFRRVLMHRFPFSVVYSASDDIIRIVAIMHQRRGPRFIVKRLDLESSDQD